VAPPLLPAAVLAMVDDEKATPYFARRSDGALIFYEAKGRWLTRAVGADGAPKTAAPLDVAGLGANVTMAALKAAGDGYLAAWVEVVAQNRDVKLLSLDADGKPRGEPVLVSQVTDDVAWLDVLPNARGALLLWEVPHDDRSDLFVVPTAGGKQEGAPQLVAHEAIGWEAEATERGAAIATVAVDPGAAAPSSRPRKKPARTPEEASQGRGTKLGKVLLTEVDTRAKASAPVVVSPEATAQLDVTLAEIGGRYVIAWTDERNIDASVYLAAVDPGGKVAAPPHRATAPFGEQALVSLVAEAYGPGAARSKRGLLVWEDQIRNLRDGRLLHLATVGGDGQLGKERAGLVLSAEGAPEIEADGEGFTAVTLAPIHDLPPGVTAAPQEGVRGDAPVWPVFVRFGADLTVTASEPLRAEPFAASDGVPYLTRALSCRAGTCTTLGMGAVTGRTPAPAKSSGARAPAEPEVPVTPAPIALFSLPSRPSPWKAPAMREDDEAPPRVSSVTALFDGEHLEKVAAADLPGQPGGTLVGWVTFVLNANIGPSPRNGKGKGKAKREEEPPTAALGVRPISPGGVPGKPVLISKKAVSEGGIALAPAPAHDGKKVETALAWVARERNEPQVFVTKLGPDGEKLAQKGVTVISRKKGDRASTATDVAIAYAGGEGGGGDGWITAWVDTRDGNAEIYAAKLDRGLTKTVPDQRITNAPGDSVEVQIAVRGKNAFLVWTDARGNPGDGKGDIYLTRLDAATLKKAGPEVRLFASAAHSRTPQIVPTKSGFVVSWIEESDDPKGAREGGGESTLRVARLDENGAVIGAPERVRVGEEQSAVTSAAIGCAGDVCRGVLTASVGEVLTLGAFRLTPGSPAGPVKTIAALTGSSQDPSPSFANPGATALFFADDAVGGNGRLRWMQIAWP
jgi:hypothetical protein